MYFKMSLLFLLMFAASILPLAAQDASSGVVAIRDNTDIVLFANSESTVLAELPLSLPDDVYVEESEYQVSDDHQWVMLTSYWPPVIAYARVGDSGPMSVIPFEDEYFDYQVLSARFSPNSQYLVFTMAVAFRWRMGFVELESGQLTSFEGEFAAGGGDFSPDLPFGNMVPLASAWSLDAKTLYLETIVPFWGCRGPHDLYAIDISDLDFSSSTIPLPPIVEIARQGDDTYSHALSPDADHLAYVFHESSCGIEGATAIALTDLASQTDEVLVAAAEGRYYQIIGWSQEGRLLYAQTPFTPSDRPGYDLTDPILKLYDMKQKATVELPALSDEPIVGARVIYAQDETLIFSLAHDDTWNSPSTLLYRPLQDTVSQQIADNVLNWSVCGNTLYYVMRTESSSVGLFSQPLDSLAGESLELATAESIKLLSCSTEEQEL